MFLADENVNGTALEQLRLRGVEILRVVDTDIDTETDREHADRRILEYAWAHQLVLVSGDRDHETMHYNWLAEGRDHYGIIFIPDRVYRNIGAIVEELELLAKASEPGEYINRLWRLE